MKAFFLPEKGELIRVTGNSMLPTLYDRQIIKVEAPVVKLYKGRCYVFIKDGMFILHRLVWNTIHYSIFMSDNTGSVEKIATQDIVATLILKNESVYQRFMITAVNIFFISIKKIPIRCQWIFAARKLIVKALLQGASTNEENIC